MRNILVFDITSPQSATASGSLKRSVLLDDDRLNFFHCFPCERGSFGIHSERISYNNQGSPSLRLTYAKLKRYIKYIGFHVIVIRLSLQNIEYLAYARDLSKLHERYIFWVLDDEFTYTKKKYPIQWKLIIREFGDWFRDSNGYWAISQELALHAGKFLGGESVVVHNTYPSEEYYTEVIESSGENEDYEITLYYSGSISRLANITSLERLLTSLIKTIPNISISIRSPEGFEVHSLLSESIKANLKFLPSANYKDYIKRTLKSNFHIVVYNFSNECKYYYKTSLPNKLPELIATRRPIVYFGPRDFLAAALVAEYPLGILIHSFRDLASIADKLADIRSRPGTVGNFRASNLPERYIPSRVRGAISDSLISDSTPMARGNQVTSFYDHRSGQSLDEELLVGDVMCYGGSCLENRGQGKHTSKAYLAGPLFRRFELLQVQRESPEYYFQMIRESLKGDHRAIRITGITSVLSDHSISAFLSSIAIIAEEYQWVLLLSIWKARKSRLSFEELLLFDKTKNFTRLQDKVINILCFKRPISVETIKAAALKRLMPDVKPSFILPSPYPPLWINNIKDLIHVARGREPVIYGASMFGCHINRFLRTNSINIFGFMDTYKSGTFDGHLIFPVSKIYELLSNNYCFMIATENPTGVLNLLLQNGAGFFYESIFILHTRILHAIRTSTLAQQKK